MISVANGVSREGQTDLGHLGDSTEVDSTYTLKSIQTRLWLNFHFWQIELDELTIDIRSLRHRHFKLIQFSRIVRLHIH